MLFASLKVSDEIDRIVAVYSRIAPFSTHLSRPRLDVLGFLLDVGRLGAEAERLCRDAVAGADAAVGVGKGVVAEADGGGGDGRTSGGGRRRPLGKGNEAAELQATLCRVVGADARFPNCA